MNRQTGQTSGNGDGLRSYENSDSEAGHASCSFSKVPIDDKAGIPEPPLEWQGSGALHFWERKSSVKRSSGLILSSIKTLQSVILLHTTVCLGRIVDYNEHACL